MTTVTDERPAATLPLPNGLAYVVAAVSLTATIASPVALIVDGRGVLAALEGRYLHTFVLFALLGALILYRRPGLVIGWLLVAIGGADAVTRLRDLYELFGLAGYGGLPTVTDVDNVIGWTVVVSIAGLAIALPQLFPDGRLVSRRWLPLAWLGAVAPVLAVGGLLVRFVVLPGATGLDGVVTAAFALFGLAMLLSLVPAVVRFHRSRGVERRQLMWVLYALAVSVPLVLAGLVPGPPEAVSAALSLPALVVVPASIAVAVLRYRLYDIDVVISRTLLVAGLAGFITVAYVAIVVGVGALLGGDAATNPVLSLVATAVVALAFQPVRVALQRVANRMVYGRRATPHDVLSGFATRIAAAEPSPDTLVRLAALMAGGTGADPARVWLRVGRQLRPAATWPDREGPVPSAVDTSAETVLPDADLARPVRDGGELLGVLTIGKPRGERITVTDTDLLDRLAAAAGVLLRNLRLDAELADRLTDIEASRRRLVTAQDGARRRIEADLARGARAHLAGLRDELADLARDTDTATAPRTAGLLTGLAAQAGGALSTLDGLAAGIYPPRLAADGPAAALAEQAARAALPITVEADDVGRYPADVESAVYFCVLEALQNAAKYAAAGSARVRLTHDGGTLRFTVTDDGAGFDTSATERGTGLQGMADRLDTVGGVLGVASVPGSGTTVTGEIPVASGDAPVPDRTPVGVPA